uniref:Uncharacterized protein n=1 Tax=Haptolina brevifila TaxID=156173 RepID=A0A7S2H5E6_9EUKA|mmetsp:Transcript_51393/g.102281  ORF Transcript_51393/g.102281 Transcript_51393/m.102281 type:complete len:102 (+) Transcript_51393:1061-1366(+)
MKMFALAMSCIAGSTAVHALSITSGNAAVHALSITSGKGAIAACKADLERQSWPIPPCSTEENCACSEQEYHADWCLCDKKGKAVCSKCRTRTQKGQALEG